MSGQRTLARGALSISILLMTGALAGVMAIAQGTPTVYAFDACDEGWEAADDHPAIQETWVRSAPGHESEEAFHVGPPYPPGIGNPDDEINATLTSAAHTAPGGNVAVSYYVNHKLETDFDYLYFEWSSDGEAWTTVDTLNGESAGFPAFVRKESVIPAPAGQLFLRFRLLSDQNASGDNLVDGEMGVDTVSVSLDRPAGTACEGGASPSGSASGSPSPDPDPDPEPEPSRHRRKVTVGFKHRSGSLIASGAVSVPDGFNACRSRVPVKIERLKSGRYAAVKAGKTSLRGKYSIKVPDQPGRYRARATKVKKGQDTCKNAIAAKQHRH